MVSVVLENNGNIVVDTAEMPGRSPRAHPVVGGKIGKVDGRSEAAKRTKRLIAEYVAMLGGPEAVDAATLAAVKRAAELMVVAERARAAALRGEADLDNLVRVERLSELAVRRLHLDCKRGPAGPTLAEYLAQHEAAE